jgi:predicted RNA binding protein YcfA (HicA-like mRNA interferase family)
LKNRHGRITDFPRKFSSDASRPALLGLDEVNVYIYTLGGAKVRSRDVIKKLEAAGWFEVRQTGSHKHFRHGERDGTVTVPHPKKDLPIGTLKSISKASGVPLP